MGYFEACKAAATNQGLDPATDRIADEGFEYEVEQTGGFCMVLTVRVATGVYGIVKDGLSEDRPWMLCWYEGDTWNEAGEETTLFSDLTLDEVVDYIRERVPA